MPRRRCLAVRLLRLGNRPLSARAVRRAWLTDVIREVHVASRGIYGSRRVHAELTIGRGITVGHNAVQMLMQRAGLQGLTGNPRRRLAPQAPTASDLVDEVNLLPSMGSIGDCFDNAIMELFWARMQVELLNRRRWKTRIELANAIFDHLEIFHNRQRRHSALGMLTPVEYERRYVMKTESVA